MRIVLALAFWGCCAASPISISGTGPFGTLAKAQITVPDNPGSSPITASATYQETYSILVSGGQGQGLLAFSGYLGATSMSRVGPEYLDSWASITAPFNAQTQPYLPAGGTGVSCAVCTVMFTFDQPQDYTFSATAFVRYSYSALSGQPPSAAGHQLASWVDLYSLSKVYSFDTHGEIDASVLFSSHNNSNSSHVPEPSTMACIALGLGIVGLRKRMRRACGNQLK